MNPYVYVVSVRGMKPDARAKVVYCGRACGPWPQSPWANPIKVKPGASLCLRRAAVEGFMSILLDRPRAVLLKDLQALYDSTHKGIKPLACWCGYWSPTPRPAPLLVCHAVELAKLVNAFRLAGVIQ